MKLQFYIEHAPFEHHMILNLHSWLSFNSVKHGQFELDPELAVALADKEHIDDFEAILRQSLAEITGNKEFMWSDRGKKYKTEQVQRCHVNNKNTSSQSLSSKDDLKLLMEEVVNKVISDCW